MNAAIDTAQDEVKSDMTPMIDCVFLLIIFFLCIDFRVLESKLEAYLPRDRGSSPSPVEPEPQLPIVIVNEADGIRSSRVAGLAPGELNPATGRPVPVRIAGHRVSWQVGPRTLHTIDDLNAELRRIHADTGTWLLDPKTGTPKPMPIVIEPGVGTFYEDVAKTVDAARDAKFDDVTFAAGSGPVPARR